MQIVLSPISQEIASFSTLMFLPISIKKKIKKLLKIFHFIRKVNDKKLYKETIWISMKAKKFYLIELVLNNLIELNKMRFKMINNLKTILLSMISTHK